jgi:transglutaminase-like putative cysteine protease
VILVSFLLAAAAARVPVKPLPAWFDEATYALPAAAANPPPTEWLLVEREIRVDESGKQLRAHRNVRRVNTPEGVQDSSEERISYDPLYERIFFHRANIVRDGRTLNALANADFRVLNRETRLEAQLLDGRLSAVLILRDVRPGDLIDLAWTVTSKPPQLAGHYSDSAYLSGDEPVARLRHRLLWPAAKPLQMQLRNGAPLPRIRQLGKEREYLWDAKVTPLHMEHDTPDSYDPYPSVDFSDFESWGAVARWALPLFTPDTAAVAGLTAPWRSLPEEERAAKALAFAREQVRYFGMEMGINGHKPHPPAQVLERRYGDCKDKALLLVSLLRSSGIEAQPALTNTRARSALDGFLPTAYAFDHAIVRAHIAGKERWLDATLTSQRGELSVLASPGYERALVLDSATVALAHLPRPDASKPLRNIEETVHARDRSSPAQLEVVSTYLGFEADEKRGVFSDTERLGKRYVEFYKTFEPDIEQRATPLVRDEPLKDQLVVTESYGIPRYWNDDLHDIFVEELRQLRPPHDASSRTMPLMLPYPFHVLQKVRIELPADTEPKVAEGTHVVTGPGLRAELYTTVTHEKDGPVVSITADLATTASSLEPKQVKEYAKLLTELDDASSLRIRLLTRPAPTAAAAIGNPPDARLGYLGFVFLGLLFGFWFGAPAMVRRFELWRSKRFYRRTQAAAGESAATPVRVEAAEDLQRHIQKQSCSCGRAFFQMPLEAGESSLVGTKTVHSVRIRCSCGISTPIFFIES